MVVTALNNQQNTYMRTINGYCYVVKSVFFAGGAVLALDTMNLGKLYYIATSTVNKSAKWGPHNHNIAKGQPQHGPSNIQPVFVPENSYS